MQYSKRELRAVENGMITSPDMDSASADAAQQFILLFLQPHLTVGSRSTCGPLRPLEIFFMHAAAKPDFPCLVLVPLMLCSYMHFPCVSVEVHHDVWAASQACQSHFES